jgi:hypothetical protein
MLTVTVGFFVGALVLSFVLGLLSPLFLVVWFIWNADVP